MAQVPGTPLLCTGWSWASPITVPGSPAERSQDEFRALMAEHLALGTGALLTPCCVTLGNSGLLRP